MKCELKKLIKYPPEINCIIQFGSTISGDYVNGVSDTDLAVIDANTGQLNIIRWNIDHKIKLIIV